MEDSEKQIEHKCVRSVGSQTDYEQLYAKVDMQHMFKTVHLQANLLVNTLEVYLRMSVMNSTSVKDSMGVLFRAAQFMESRTSFANQHELTFDVINTLIETVASAYRVLYNIACMLPDTQKIDVMRPIKHLQAYIDAIQTTRILCTIANVNQAFAS